MNNKLDQVNFVENIDWESVCDWTKIVAFFLVIVAVIGLFVFAGVSYAESFEKATVVAVEEIGEETVVKQDVGSYVAYNALGNQAMAMTSLNKVENKTSYNVTFKLEDGSTYVKEGTTTKYEVGKTYEIQTESAK